MDGVFVVIFFARLFPFPIDTFAAIFFTAGALMTLMTLPLAEALAPLVEVEVAFSLKRGFFVARPVNSAALRFDARRRGSGPLAVEEASGMMAADLE